MLQWHIKGIKNEVNMIHELSNWTWSILYWWLSFQTYKKCMYKTYHLLAFHYILMLSIFLQLFLSVVPISWKYYLMICYCASLLNSAFSDVILAAWNQSQWQYLCHRNRKVLQRTSVCSTWRLVVNFIPIHYSTYYFFKTFLPPPYMPE